MAIEIKMPQLSDTMHSGKILSWKKKEGDKVSRGDVLAEVETEKANLEIESFHQGTLLKVFVPAQTPANVGDVIALIGEPGEAAGASARASASTSTNGSSAKVATPVAAAPVSSSPASSSPVASSPTPASASTSSTSYAPTPPSPSPANSGRIKASPLAKKIAAENNIDLSSIRGSGPDGRIVRNDLAATAKGSGSITRGSFAATPSAAPTAHAPAASSSMTSAAIAATPASATPAGSGQAGAGATREMSKMRALIASRMQESVREAPHFYVTTKINMGEAKRLQIALKAKPEFAHLSINHFVIKAAAHALAREPRVNNAVRNGQIFSPGSINIGIITAVEDGLLIPVIREADKLSLKDLAFEAKAAIERAKAGRPTSADLSGGTFSISNMGMFDVENFTAIINPGQGAVLAVSSIVTEPVVLKGQIVIGETMKVTLSVDHRIIDGVMGATFLKHFKEALELPALLML